MSASIADRWSPYPDSVRDALCAERRFCAFFCACARGREVERSANTSPESEHEHPSRP